MFWYIKCVDGKLESGSCGLKEISNGKYDYKGKVVTLNKYHNFNGIRVVFSESHSKCQEVFKKSLDEEIDGLMDVYNQLQRSDLIE